MLTHEKAAQAVALLDELDMDCWLSFGRETSEHPDPGIDLVVGTAVTWNSAFLFGRDGSRTAIVGRYDVENIRTTGVFPEIVGYDADIRADLVAALDRLKPRQIGLNYSVHDTSADGLTYGLWLLLHDVLRDTPYPDRFTSAAPLLSRLRARKTPAEVERIRAAIATTNEIVAELTPQIVPDASEAQLAAFVHNAFAKRGLDSAWEWDYCPTVNSGPDSPIGHVPPQERITVQPGHLVHIDLGVKQDGYCSDLQRMWYVRRPGETTLPPSLQRGWDAVQRAIEAGAAALKPGIPGWQVDAVAREALVAAGYPEYQHALGHSLGRACHDGGPLLGPRWPRYGDSPMMPVEVGNVFTLELEVFTEAGMLAIEEDVLVTESGCEFMSEFQREPILI